MIQRGTPCPAPANSAVGGEEDARLLPTLSPYRSVLSSGQSCQWSNGNGTLKEPQHIPVKLEGSRLQSCGKDPRNILAASPHLDHAHVTRPRHHLAPLSPSGHHLRPPVGSSYGHHLTPTSPTFSDISSIRLTPRSPAAGHYGVAESPCNNGKYRTPGRNKAFPTISSGVLMPLSVELDEASVSPLIPSITSYSPYGGYLHTPVDQSSPHGVAAAAINSGHFSRKRPLSSSPLSDLVDFNSIIRTSPSSLVAYINNSQSPAGVMGHLVGPPALIHRTSEVRQQQKTTTTTITNHITITTQQHAGIPGECSSNMTLIMPPPSARQEGASQQEDNEPIEPLVCRWQGCELMFDEQDDMVRHIEKVHVEEQRRGNDFICLWQGCGREKKPFNARYKLLIHMRIHSGEKPNKCSYPGCNKAFSRLENLKIHMRSHTGERPYICQFPGCQKSFSNSSDRSKHQRTHIEEKPYACTFPNCAKRYTDPSSLRKHARTHQQSCKKARNEEQLDSCLVVHGIQKSEKQQFNNNTAAMGKKSPPVLVHHQPDMPIYPVTTVMTDLQYPPSPYHLAASHSPMMQQSPMMQKSSHSPMMQHSPADHNCSPGLQPPPHGSFLSVTSPFSNPPSPMAYSPANVQFTQGGGACHIYPSPQEVIPNRPPPDYPGNGYYGMTVTTYSHDQI